MSRILFVAGMNTRRVAPETFYKGYYQALIEALRKVGLDGEGAVALPKQQDVGLMYWTDLIVDGMDAVEAPTVVRYPRSNEPSTACETRTRRHAAMQPRWYATANRVLRRIEDAWLSFCRKRLLALDASANYDVDARQTLLGRMFKPVLIQAAAYMANVRACSVPFPREDTGLRNQAIARFKSMITDDTRIVIGHSLGSVIAYEGLRALSGNHRVQLLLTVGSPIGTPNLIYSRLGAKPPFAWPEVARWCNVACAQDVFFVPVERIQHLFKGQVEDFRVRHGAPWSPDRTHRLRSYFRHPLIGAILAEAWAVGAEQPTQPPQTMAMRREPPAPTPLVYDSSST